MSKSSYRDYFAECRKFIKMRYFLNISGISESNFSLFMKDSAYDYTVSVDKLDLLRSSISDVLGKIV